MLAQCLNANKDVVIPDKTDFIIPTAFISLKVKNPDIGRELIWKTIVNSERFAHSIGQYIDPNEVYICVQRADYKAKDILDLIYSRIALAANKTIAGDKSPNDIMNMRTMVESRIVDKTVKIIHIVCDIRDLMISLNKTGWANDFDNYFPRIWSSSNLYLKYEMEREDSNYLLIKYENFVAAPSQELRKACRLLGVEYSDTMLLPENRNNRYRDVAHHANLYKPINSSSVHLFQNNISKDVLEKYEAQAGEALRNFGYI